MLSSLAVASSLLVSKKLLLRPAVPAPRPRTRTRTRELGGGCRYALAYTIADRPVGPRLLTQWARAGRGAQGR